MGMRSAGLSSGAQKNMCLLVLWTGSSALGGGSQASKSYTGSRLGGILPKTWLGDIPPRFLGKWYWCQDQDQMELWLIPLGYGAASRISVKTILTILPSWHRPAFSEWPFSILGSTRILQVPDWILKHNKGFFFFFPFCGWLLNFCWGGINGEPLI